MKEFKENDLDFNLFLFFDERVSIFSLDDSNRIWNDFLFMKFMKEFELYQ